MSKLCKTPQKYFKMKQLILYIILGIGFISCQEEQDIDTSNQNTNNKESVYTAKAKRNSLLDGRIDDVLDQLPCASLVLPAQIVLNQVPISINTPEEIKIIQPNDVIQFIYPVTLTTQDYKTVVIENEQQFIEYRAKCNTLIDDNNTSISCVEIKFPISIFIYVAHEQPYKIVIDSKKDFFFFLDNLSTEIYSVEYPIDITVSETTISIGNDEAYLNQLDLCRY